MKWLAIDAYHWRRECGRYFVDRAIVPTSATGERFCAWFKQHEDAVPELLGCRDTRGEATALCAGHLRAHRVSFNFQQPLQPVSTTQAQLAL